MKNIILKFVKGWLVLTLMCTFKYVVAAAAIYTGVALIVQTLINKGVIGKSACQFLIKLKLAKKVGKKVILRTPITFAKKVILWVASDAILPPKAQRAFHDLAEAGNREFTVTEPDGAEGEDAEGPVEPEA